MSELNNNIKTLTMEDLTDVEKKEIIMFAMQSSDFGIDSARDMLWLQKYWMAKKYYIEYGNLNVPSHFNSNYILDKNTEKLWNWISRQRTVNKEGKLSEVKVKLLEDIGMIWNVKDFVLMENMKYEIELAEQQRKIVIENTTEEEQKEIIEFIMKSPDFSLNNPNDLLWLQNYWLAKKYYTKCGNLEVPSSYQFSGDKNQKKLWSWISMQRMNYQDKKLSEAKIKLLEDIEMVWNAGYNMNYYNRYNKYNRR